jgi:hypothetical protein
VVLLILFEGCGLSDPEDRGRGQGGVCAECSGGFGSRNASFLGLHLENLITSGIGALCLRLWPRFIRISRAGPKIDALRPRVLAAYRGQLRNSKHNRAVQVGARFSEREAGVGRLDSSDLASFELAFGR